MTSEMAGAGRRTRYLSALGILVGMGLLGILIPVRSGVVITSSGQALSSANELYVFVEQNKLAWSENLWSFAWRSIKTWLTATTPPSFHRIDCTVYHITNNAVDEHRAEGWHVIGALAPYKGEPHAFMGSDLNWEVYRWTGAEFSKLSPAERSAAKSGYTYSDELFKREGWTQEYVLPVRGTAEHRIILAGIPVTIKATQFSEDTRSVSPITSKIDLIRGDDPKSSQVLYNFTDKTVFLSAQEYKRFTE